jgi:hypothetical protein
MAVLSEVQSWRCYTGITCQRSQQKAHWANLGCLGVFKAERPRAWLVQRSMVAGAGTAHTEYQRTMTLSQGFLSFPGGDDVMGCKSPMAMTAAALLLLYAAAVMPLASWL